MVQFFYEILEQNTKGMMKVLSLASAKLIQTDSYEYVEELCFTTQRSLLTPFFFLTEWFNKTNSERICRELNYMCNSIINYIMDGSIIDKLKALATTALTEHDFSVYKLFYMGTLSKVLRQKLFLSKGSNGKRKMLSAMSFFYSLNQMKTGLSRLPMENVFKNIDSTVDKLNKVDQAKLDSLNGNPSMQWILKFVTDLVIRGNEHLYKEKRFLPVGATFEYKHDEVRENFISQTLNVSFEAKEKIFDDEFRKFNRGDPQWARVAVLDEPLKNRFLTINSTGFQMGTRELQTFLTKCWKRSEFSTMDDDRLNHDLLTKFYGLFPNEYVTSIDYSSATDNLLSQVTHIIINEITRILYNSDTISYDELRYYRSALAAKVITFDRALYVSTIQGSKYLRRVKDYFNGKGTFNQVGGQMMGNTLSFTLLCIANLSTFIYAKFMNSPEGSFKRHLKWYIQNNTLPRDPRHFLQRFYDQNVERLGWWLFINGDDAVGKLTLQENILQERCSTCYGLIRNKLKTINNSEKVFNINSRQFYFNEEGLVYEIGHLNQRVMYNWNVKQMIREIVEDVEVDFVGLYNKLIEQLSHTQPIENLNSVSDFFLKIHHKREELFIEDRFLSTRVGGKSMTSLLYTTPPRISRSRVLTIHKFLKRKFLGVGLVNESPFWELNWQKEIDCFVKKGDHVFNVGQKKITKSSYYIAMIAKFKIYLLYALGYIKVSYLESPDSEEYDDIFNRILTKTSSVYSLCDLSREYEFVSTWDFFLDKYTPILEAAKGFLETDLIFNDLAIQNYGYFFESDFCGLHISRTERTPDVNSEEFLLISLCLIDFSL